MSSGSYNPGEIEDRIGGFWEQGRFFDADPPPSEAGAATADTRASAGAEPGAARPGPRQPYVIVIPPPNVTGSLHLGHALNNTLQDILIRHKRMAGYVTCWLPGTDHAGIATQAVVEKRLREEEKFIPDRKNPTHRDHVVRKIWEWKDEYNARILAQLRKMGCSCDWRRTRFTLDEGCVRAVYELFFRFFSAGLIYRGTRLVNWDTQLQTAVADDEVYHETVKGHIWHIRYPLAADSDRRGGAAAPHLVVATTRPETMLADTAVAVHPDDARYRQLIGRHVTLPLTGRTIPVIADPILVNPEFGTGCVKVTPGHDPNDYACYQRHPEIGIRNMMTPDGRVHADNAGAQSQYAGLKVDEARKRVVADLEAAGLLEQVEPYETDVGHSDRSKTPIQPYLSEQWFLKMGDDRLAEPALEAVRDGRVRFFPERFAKSYLDWLGEKRDWCISRQLWWGHRIPVWTKRMTHGEHTAWMNRDGLACELFAEDERMSVRVVSDDGRSYTIGGPGYTGSNEERFIDEMGYDERVTWHVCLRSEHERHFKSGESIAAWLEAAGFTRDPDVLDTWFSSMLWPFSTFGWPEPTRDVDYFYPTSVLSTARDIISLWVVRMVLSGLYCTGRVPFQHVFIHPTIQDAQGRRMSKSAGNGVDPLDLIELYGADAMRFTLASLAGETQDVRIPVQPVTRPDGRVVNSSERFELGRNFCNKLWNAANGVVFANLAGPGGLVRARPLTRAALAGEDQWILARLDATIAEAQARIERYEFSALAGLLYAFFWNDFCDWYVELVKPRLFEKRDGDFVQRTDDSACAARQVLAWVLDQSLRLLHPIIPFITEELWARLNRIAPLRGIETVAGPADALIIARWPEAAAPRASEIERTMGVLQSIITALRDTLARINSNRAAARQTAIGKLPRALVRPTDGADAALQDRLRSQAAVMERLGRCEQVAVDAALVKPSGCASHVLGLVEVYVPLEGLMDVAAERERLGRELREAQAALERLSAKLGNAGFVSKAPPAVIEQERAREGELATRIAGLQRNLADLE